MTEFEQKQQIISDLLARHNLDALVLRRVSSFRVGHLRCGVVREHGDDRGRGDPAWSRRAVGIVITNNIEAPAAGAGRETVRAGLGVSRHALARGARRGGRTDARL